MREANINDELIAVVVSSKFGQTGDTRDGGPGHHEIPLLSP
jgi:hypothetical protein